MVQTSYIDWRFKMNRPAASQINEPLWEMDRAHSLHPWTNFGPFEKDGALVITRGDGAYLWDAEGRKYFDAVGGLWCTNIGLGRREMADAIADQAHQLAFSNTFVDMTNGPTARLAAKIAELAPGDLNRVHFTTGGSTAVDTAVRMVSYYQHARGFPDKTDIVARDYSYHGSTYLSQSVGKRPGDRVEEFRYKTEGIHHLSCPNPYRRPEGMSEADYCDHLVREFEDLIARVGADRIGGFIAEPIQASGGIIIPPEGYLKRMWQVCQRHEILFIADEVVTAWGRLVRLVGRVRGPARYHHHGKRADLGLYPAGGCRVLGPDLGCDGQGWGAVVHQRVHLFGASGRLRGGAEEYRDHGA
jgi:adenosylmethionine-8-amino-7-oxononanoate aminotransferase